MRNGMTPKIRATGGFLSGNPWLHSLLPCLSHQQVSRLVFPYPKKGTEPQNNKNNRERERREREREREREKKKIERERDREIEREGEKQKKRKTKRQRARSRELSARETRGPAMKKTTAPGNGFAEEIALDRWPNPIPSVERWVAWTQRKYQNTHEHEREWSLP